MLETIISVGSVCSGIEAASVALDDKSYNIKWFAELAEEPSRILKERYPSIPNYGDMCILPSLINNREIKAPDIICGGTPCQAFSLAGWKKGLNDDRGNLTLKFVDIINENDAIRKEHDKPKTVMLWENVENVLKDKTNAFGCFLASLLGYNHEIKSKKWPSSGVIHGNGRNVAWRVVDAKYFGLPHQRKRLYVLSGGKDFYPENVLFDGFPKPFVDYGEQPLFFDKQGHKIEVFRSYTDCLYSAYGTKWNGNAAAYNGSLFIVQNERLRRLTPLECERLMGFPDNYTVIPKIKRTNQYMAIGNSWAVPVIRWLGSRLSNELQNKSNSILTKEACASNELDGLDNNDMYFNIATKENLSLGRNNINGSPIPEFPILGNISDIIDINPDEKLYISPVGCKGILRRKEERGLNINSRLEYHLTNISSQMPAEDIEKASRVQKRGRFSTYA